jgi:hypothetical protein
VFIRGKFQTSGLSVTMLLACPFGHIGSVSVTKKTEGTEDLSFFRMWCA